MCAGLRGTLDPAMGRSRALCRTVLPLGAGALLAESMNVQPAQATSFCLEEATIDQLHAAIRAGQTTCAAVVAHYLARVRAFNGVCSMLVTHDGAPVAAADGAVRAMAPIRFPTKTIKA